MGDQSQELFTIAQATEKSEKPPYARQTLTL